MRLAVVVSVMMLGLGVELTRADTHHEWLCRGAARLMLGQSVAITRTEPQEAEVWLFYQSEDGSEKHARCQFPGPGRLNWVIRQAHPMGFERTRIHYVRYKELEGNTEFSERQGAWITPGLLLPTPAEQPGQSVSGPETGP